MTCWLKPILERLLARWIAARRVQVPRLLSQPPMLGDGSLESRVSLTVTSEVVASAGRGGGSSASANANGTAIRATRLFHIMGSGLHRWDQLHRDTGALLVPVATEFTRAVPMS